MAYWDGEKIVHSKPGDCPQYPGWQEIDCGCCSGIEWGGEYPRECRACGGGGFVYHHFSSGVLAQYPGGPLLGKTTKKEKA